MVTTVDWDTARSVAARVAKDDGFEQTYRAQSLRDDMAELTPQAEKLVEEETGLVSLSGQARGKVVDRAAWVDANLASFDRLMRPLLAKLERKHDEAKDGKPSTASQILAPLGNALNLAAGKVGPKVTGGELGILLGWMSGRVIGQYDLLVIEDERPEDQDWVYFVGPNMLALEERYGFPPEEFRLWVAIHECTHRAQFTAVPWLRPHFLGLVNELIDAVDPDPKAFLETIKKIAEQKRNGEAVIDKGGISSLFASDEQKEIMDRMTGLMSLLEGHGDIVMDRAGKDLIPSQPRFHRVFANRRNKSTGAAKVMQRLMGMEAKMAQYAEGERFVESVEAAGGPELFARVWEQAEHLPTGAEIKDPSLWVQRMT
jgi:coenzyme F420 biosynthesis associated uncharacterized protein